MRCLIYQYYEYFDHKESVRVSDDYITLSRKSLSAYAQKCGADYRFLNEGAPHYPYFGIFLPFLQGWASDYDKICFVDCDVLATVNSQNVFEESSDIAMSANHMNDGPLVVPHIPHSDHFGTMGHMNSGVVVFPKSMHKSIVEYIGDLSYFSKLKDKSLGDYDQQVINLFGMDHGRGHLNHAFNYHMSRYDKEQRFDKSLIHYHRDNKHLMFVDFKDERILK